MTVILDMEEVGRRLHQHKRKMTLLARQGEFDGYNVFKIGREWLMAEDDFERYLRYRRGLKEVDKTAGITESVAD